MEWNTVFITLIGALFGFLLGLLSNFIQHRKDTRKLLLSLKGEYDAISWHLYDCARKYRYDSYDSAFISSYVIALESGQINSAQMPFSPSMGEKSMTNLGIDLNEYNNATKQLIQCISTFTLYSKKGVRIIELMNKIKEYDPADKTKIDSVGISNLRHSNLDRFVSDGYVHLKRELKEELLDNLERELLEIIGKRKY